MMDWPIATTILGFLATVVVSIIRFGPQRDLSTKYATLTEHQLLKQHVEHLSTELKENINRLSEQIKTEVTQVATQLAKHEGKEELRWDRLWKRLDGTEK